jgi:protein-tyrosine-phosphatase
LPDHLDPATRRRLERDFKDLRDEFTPVLGAEAVESCLQGCLDSLVVHARLNSFVPLLAQRFAREQLGAAAQNQGLLDKTVPEVLFVCTHDAGRTQMAAALLDHHAAGAVHVRTAGTNPSAELNPVVAATLAQRDLTLSAAYAKPLTDTVIRAADIVVTLGCPDAVHTEPGQEHYDWDVPDPEGKPPDAVSAVCDDLDRRVTDLLAHINQLQAQKGSDQL